MRPGKRDLPVALRNRFTELYLPEPNAREDLRALVAAYLGGTVPNPPVDAVVDFYLAAKAEAVRALLLPIPGRPSGNSDLLASADRCLGVGARPTCR